MKENKNSKIIISAVAIFFLVAIGLIATGKIKLSDIMGNTAQGQYTCPTGYVLKNTNCYGTQMTCPAGTVASSDSKCRKTTYTYTCPSGYVKYGTSQCRKILGYTYTCPSGYVKSGTSQCRKTTYIYVCPSGYVKYGTSQCRKTTYVYVCPSGYVKSGTSQCRKTTYAYVCPSGYVKYGSSRCKKGKTIINATRKTQYSTINATSKPQYSTINATGKPQYNTINATSTPKYSTINATQYTKTEYVNKISKSIVIPATKRGVEIEKISVTASRSDFSTSTNLSTDNHNGIIVMATPGKNQVSITCTSSNSNVIRLNQTTYSFKESVRLNVSAIGAGTATITCKTSDNQTSSVTTKICNAEDFDIPNYGGCKQ